MKGIISLEDALKGKAGQAIRSFYQECHLSFLLYFESFIEDYKAVLQSMKNQLKNFEPDPNGFISESFLDHDVRAGLHKIETTTIGIISEANEAMKKVRDIIDLPDLDETHLVESIRQAKRYSNHTIEQLHAFDKAQTAALETVEQDLALMANYINQISSAIKNGEVNVSNYSVKQITSYDTYNDLIGDLAQKTNPYENTIRRPNADEQLIAASYIAQLQNKNVTKEEFETLQDQKIETVHVIDEYAEYDGDYHILANGMIVREYKDKNFNKQYQIVDKVPKNRAGGVRELDSPFEGTPLEIAEYAAFPATLVKKGVTKLGKKAITGIEKKVMKEYTGGTGKETYQHLKDYKNNKYFTRSVVYNAGKDGTGFTYKVYQRGDINWDMVRTKGAKKGRGLTNAEASAKYGLAPILDDAGSVATLHHSQQKGVGPLYEASTRYHNISNAKKAPLHPYKGKLNPFYPMDETTRGAFQKVDSINYWKIRGEEALGGK